MKTAIYILSVLALITLGYAAGVFFQHQREVRSLAAMNLYQAIKLHKELSVGYYAYDRALHEAENQIDSSLQYFYYSDTIYDLPRLLRAGAFDQFEADWQDKALAMAVSLHRMRPDISFSSKAKQRMETFVPSNDTVRQALTYYSYYDPWKPPLHNPPLPAR